MDEWVRWKWLVVRRVNQGSGEDVLWEVSGGEEKEEGANATFGAEAREKGGTRSVGCR